MIKILGSIRFIVGMVIEKDYYIIKIALSYHDSYFHELQEILIYPLLIGIFARMNRVGCKIFT